MRRSKLILIGIQAIVLLAFTSRLEDPAGDLVAALQRWTEINPQEKVYLHTDRSDYIPGDTIWFKGYVTLGSRHQLSKLSGALYVELIDEKDSLLNSLKLPLTAGMAMGDFVLDDAYRGINFRIRAYTQWMRNAGEEYFYDRSFAVVGAVEAAGPGSRKEPGQKEKSKTTGDAQKDLSASKIDVQFFPEGGTMVLGMNSRVGFKSTGTNGLGMGVKGTIVDDSGQEITNLESLHAGMGVFNLRPEAVRSYLARLEFADGSKQEVRIPKAVDQGYVLSIYQPNTDSVLVRISASQLLCQTPHSVILMVQSGGEMIYTSRVSISRPLNSIWLLKKDFPSGIAQFTLFDRNLEPLNERIAFIKNGDQMRLELNMAKKSYKTRERVELDLLARDKSGRAVAGNFSVSVIADSGLPSGNLGESTIFSSLLLSSDIRGYIERPEYYFTGETEEKNKALDNLMLTQGYRRFAWKEILKNSAPVAKPLYPAESLGTDISGRLLTLGGKPVVNGSITLMALAQGFMEEAKTDTSGRFTYKPIMLGDSIKFTLQGRTAKKSKKVQFVLDRVNDQLIGVNKNKPDFNNKLAGLPVARSTKEVVLSQENPVNIVGKKLEEVKIRASKKWDFGNHINENQADEVYRPDAKQPCNTLKECLEEMYRSRVNFNMILGACGMIWQPQLGKAAYAVLIDDVLIETCDYQDFILSEPTDIEKVYFAHEGKTIPARLLSSYLNRFDPKALPPVMAIYTKSGNYRKKYDPSIAVYKPKGFNKAREFFMPRYDRPGLDQQRPDLRRTIYWNPKVKTLESGRMSLSFVNSDVPGSYQVVVEGINAEGELGRQVYRYEVEAGPAISVASQGPSPGVKPLVTAMQDLQKRLPAEKLYLHTDRSYYNLGDTLWFKAYLFDAASLSASQKSGLLYVELIDDTAEAVRRISIPIKKGIGYAQIPLPGKIFHEGGYTLRAYTHWMRNFGEGCFFTKKFYLGFPAPSTWLVRASSKITRAAGKEYLDANFLLSRSGEAPAALRDVELKLMDEDGRLYKEIRQTSLEGALDLKYELKAKSATKYLRAEIRSLHPNDGKQVLVIPLRVNRTQNIDLQFLPEGGHLVAGLKSRVGFKALEEDGRGVQVSGVVLDSKGKEVTAFKSLHGGMGSFDFFPLQGESYTAKLKDPEQTETVYRFPVVKSAGTVLSISNLQDSDSLKVTLLSSMDIFQGDSTYALTAVSAGAVRYTRELDPADLNFSVAKSSFPSGIAVFTLLRNRTPLNERSVFIDHHDGLQFRIAANKTNYRKRDSVGLEIEVSGKNGMPVQGTFSLAVTDDRQTDPDSSGNFSMATGLLFNPALKGHVEAPGYYLNSVNRDRWEALDNLMLTQGWTSYDWPGLSDEAKAPDFSAQPGFRITGTVKSAFKKPIAGAPVLLSSKKPFFIRSTITNDKGLYVFENLPQTDSGSFFIQAKSVKNKTMNFGEVTVDRILPAEIKKTTQAQVLPWYVNTAVAQVSYVRLHEKAATENLRLSGKGMTLKEVKIKSKRSLLGLLKTNMDPDIVFDETDIKESGTTNLYQLLRQKLPSFRIVMEEGLPTAKFDKYVVDVGTSSGPLPIRVDPYPTVEQVKAQLSEIKIVNFKALLITYNYGANALLYNVRYAYGPNGERVGIKGIPSKDVLEAQSNLKSKGSDHYILDRFNLAVTSSNASPEFATIDIITTSQSDGSFNNKPDFATLRPLPIMQPQAFYSPKYLPNDTIKTPDYRPTIFWKPDITTDEKGKARISFYTSDIEGSYSINIQGADMDGNIGSKLSKLKISSGLNQ